MKDFYLNVGHVVQGAAVRRCRAFADAGSRVRPLLNAAETHVGRKAPSRWRGPFNQSFIFREINVMERCAQSGCSESRMASEARIKGSGCLVYPSG